MVYIKFFCPNRNLGRQVSHDFFLYLQGIEQCNTMVFETTYYRPWSRVKNRRRTPAPRAARKVRRRFFTSFWAAAAPL